MQNSFQTLTSGTTAPSLHGDCDKPFVSDFIFMEKEIWVVINGFPNYEISNSGKIRSYSEGYRCKIGTNREHIRKDKPSIITPCISGNGYLVFVVSKNTIRKTLSVHREMAKAFIPNPLNYKLVRHLNDIKSDNRIENLAWGTQSDNKKDFIINGRSHYNNDKGAATPKLTEHQVLFILNSAKNTVELAKIFNVTPAAISRIRTGLSWRNVTKLPKPLKLNK